MGSVTVPPKFQVVIPQAVRLALRAAALGMRHKLPLADSIVYATARRAQATVWTQDAHFDGLDAVRYYATSL